MIYKHKIKHFDPLKNKIPRNWTGSRTMHCNKCNWKPKCKIRIDTSSTGQFAKKWECKDNCAQSCYTSCNTSCNTSYNTSCNTQCPPTSHCNDKYVEKNCACNHCDPCKKCYCEQIKPCPKPILPCLAKLVTDKSPVYNCNSTCNTNTYNQYAHDDCPEIVIKYINNSNSKLCDNIVELNVPRGGSKEKYLAQFSQEFRDNNDFMCAEEITYNNCPNNIIDNRREEEFTILDERALVKMNIKNRILAEKYAKNNTHKHSLAPSGTQSYKYGNQSKTGLVGTAITGNPYFDLCNC